MFCTVVVLGLSTAWFLRVSKTIVEDDENRVRGQLQEFVHIALAAIKPQIIKYKNGEITRNQAIKDIEGLLGPVRFDCPQGDNYVFIGSQEGEIVVHPYLSDPDRLSKYKPMLTSTMLKFAEFVKERPQGGFITYPFPGQQGDSGLKMAFIYPVPELKIFVGSASWDKNIRRMEGGFVIQTVFVAVVLMVLVVLPSLIALRELEKRNRALAEEVESRAAAEEALRQSEEQYRMAMASSSDGLMDWDVLGGEAFFSPRLFALLGMERQNSIMDFDSLTALMHPDDFGDFALVRNAFRTGAIKFHEGTYRLRHQDGDWRWFHTTARVFATDENGQSVRVVGAFSDITDKKKNEFERQRLATQLRQNQKMEAVGTLAGGIAHEFNNLLTVILGFTQVSLRKVKQGGVPEKELGEVIDASTRARDLVKQLLMFSRQKSTDKTELDLRPLVKESVRFMRSSLPSSLEMEFYISPEPMLVHANSSGIHQILVNLINNAAQAMPGGGKLTVSLDATTDPAFCEAVSDGGNGCARLLVEDEGEGMANDIADRIFDPFFTTRGVGGGSGLGLSVVDGIVREHGGVVWGRNKHDGKGAMFEVILPLTQPSEPAREIPPEPVVTGHGNLILVEDDPEVLEVGRAMLEGLGYNVSTFTGAEKAMDAFQRDPARFDVLITDFMMPVVSGLELMNQVHFIKPEMPTLIISGGGDAALIKEAMEQGAVKVLIKPFSMSELSMAVFEVLGGEEQPNAEEGD